MRMPRALIRDNQAMLTKLVIIAAVMFGFGYAMVPLYKHICQALGINVLAASRGGVAEAPKNTLIDKSRVVTVEFDANTRGPWHFKPAQASMDVHPGEMVTVMYEFQNVQNRTMAAQAIPSYAPRQAEAHFNKVECFCFTQYTLAPGEKKLWPVTFYLDPKLSRDVRTITLSYTFFEVGGKTPSTPPTAAGPDAEKGPQG